MHIGESFDTVFSMGYWSVKSVGGRVNSDLCHHLALPRPALQIHTECVMPYFIQYGRRLYIHQYVSLCQWNISHHYIHIYRKRYFGIKGNKSDKCIRPCVFLGTKTGNIFWLWAQKIRPILFMEVGGHTYVTRYIFG